MQLSIFICAGVVHPKAIEYLKDRNLVITQKVLAFPYYINLKDFSYAAVGFSVAHTLSYLATYLSHKNIIFIGQDLAYAENGNSHPDDYQNSANYESQMYEHILTTAYGGNGKVETHSIWLLFKNWFENEMIPNTRKMGITTYNCTEGGARIEGTIEKPFLWACENLLHKDLNKPFEKLEPLSLNKQNEFLLKAYYKVYQSIKHCRDFSKILSNDFENIQSIYLSLNEKEEDINLAIEKIDKFKNKLEDIKQMQDLYEILQPLRTQFELNLARIYVLNPKTKEDAFNKSILWIKEHLEFMELVEKVREENNFNKNLKALSGFEYNDLRKKLEDLKELREFTFTQGKDNLDINIIKKRNLKKMYQDPIKELEKNLEYFKDFTRYPVLFFYGFGNGILYKILLQNQALKRIIIFEKELELIFLALNFIDFSKDLSLGRLIILHHDDINLPKMDKVFRLIGDLFYRSYNLHIANDFYEHYKEDILKLNKLNMQIIKNHNLMRGNDPKDAMQGIEQLFIIFLKYGKNFYYCCKNFLSFKQGSGTSKNYAFDFHK